MNKKGFTLIELLVVIAIIGLLSTLAVVALNSAREQARDSKRVSDMKAIQTALESYFSQNDAYPTADPAVTLGAGSYACLNSSGWGTAGCSSPYLGLVPADPLASGSYTYYSVDGSTYTVSTTLETGVANLNAGGISASPVGIQ